MSDHLHSAQRARALDQLSSPRGVIAGAAIDHRDSLQAVLAKRGLELDHAGITRLKVRVASVLAPAATMVLLDAEYAAAQALAAGAVPGSTGVAVPLEGMGYGDVAKLDVTTFLEGWSPEKGRRLRSEEHTSELQSHSHLVCRLLLEKKKKKNKETHATPPQLSTSSA